MQSLGVVGGMQVVVAVVFIDEVVVKLRKTTGVGVVALGWLVVVKTVLLVMFATGLIVPKGDEIVVELTYCAGVRAVALS